MASCQESELETDWQTNKNLSECLGYMLDNEVMCDVTFRVGIDLSPIKAHKFVLASRSPVFYTMFIGSIPETGEIQVPDVNVATFQMLLKYMYCDTLNLTTENVRQVLYAADKYMLWKVKFACSELLKTTVRTADAALVLQTAHDFNMVDLFKESLRYIEKNSAECISSQHALQLSKECLKTIFKSDFLSCSETDLLKFFMAWCENQCKLNDEAVTGGNMRHFADDVLQMVRFPHVDKEYFSDEISESGLLTEKEVITIFKSFYGKKKELRTTKERLPIASRKTYKITRHANVQPRGWKKTGSEALICQTDTAIWLKGIILFGPGKIYDGFRNCYVSVKRECTIEIDVYYGDEILLSESHSITTKSCEIFDVMLNDVIPLEIGKPYTILINGINFDSGYGGNCKQCCVDNNEITIEFSDSPLCTTGTNTTTGQIAGLLYSV